MIRANGSSPLTRGKQKFADTLKFAGRLIPTHAGKTLWRLVLNLIHRAHPHSRGENCPARRRLCLRPGSSPLTRGKQSSRREYCHIFGLIPTHAGKTFRASCARMAAAAHPHSRGENGQDGHDEGAPAGSSPLTRGKLGRRQRSRSHRGLIPTHAGKTSWISSAMRPPRAHPHSRGENPPPCL